MYTVTIGTEIFNADTLKAAKTIAANAWGNKAIIKKVTAKFVAPVLKCYYRGEEVKYIEGRQNGYTLVHSGTKATFMAVTAELEYR